MRCECAPEPELGAREMEKGRVVLHYLLRTYFTPFGGEIGGLTTTYRKKRGPLLLDHGKFAIMLEEVMVEGFTCTTEERKAIKSLADKTRNVNPKFFETARDVQAWLKQNLNQ